MYFTINEAREAARAKTFVGMESRTLAESMRFSSDYDEYDVFLSHSMSDAQIVLGVKTILENQYGLKVYVDWIEDKQLNRELVTAATAELLRKRMKQSGSLFYLTTENSSKSKWMPWELGYFDGLKPNKVAILPVLKSRYDDFKGQEYLGLYPVASKDTIKSFALKLSRF